MAEERNNEISELLDKLREKTVAEAVPEKKKSSKKQNMTDEDVKNLLRRYFDNVETSGNAEPEEKSEEPINLFDLDTSDFVEVTEDEPVEEEIIDEDELVELDALDESEYTDELYAVDDFTDEDIPEDEQIKDEIIYDYIYEGEEPRPEIEEETEETEPEPIEEEIPEPVSDISYEGVKDADIDVMVALGFGDKIKEKFGDERIMRAARNIKKNSEKLESERAFGYIGEEYSSPEQNDRIRTSFERDQRRLIARFSVTVAMSILLLIYENAQIFGITLSGIFDMARYPAAYTMFSLQLLVLCALPSWRNLYDGLLSLLNQKPTARTLLCAALAVTVVYDIVIAIVSPTDGVMLFGFSMSLGLVFSVLAEYLDYMREKRTFRMISGDGEKYVLTETGVTSDGRVVLSAEKTKFISGYFERTGKHEQNTSFMIFSVVPLIAVSVVLCVVSAALGQGASSALGIFAGSFAFGVPLTQIVGIALSEFGISASLRADAAVVGNSVPDEYSDAAVVTVDDDFAFAVGSATVSAIKIYNNNDIYGTLYNISALYRVAGGPLCAAFAEATAQLGDPRSVSLGEYGTDFISVTVDGRSEVCAGSRAAFSLRGIELPKKDHISDGNALVYIAVNGKLSAAIAAKYELSREFSAAQRSLSKEGIALRIRSLDPAVNEELTGKLCNFGEPIEVSKEQPRTEATECADAGVISKKGIFGLIRPLILRRRARSFMRVFGTIRHIETAACVAFGAALMLTSMRVGVSALSGLCQLVCFGVLTVAFSVMRKNNMKF